MMCDPPKNVNPSLQMGTPDHISSVSFTLQRQNTRESRGPITGQQQAAKAKVHQAQSAFKPIPQRPGHLALCLSSYDDDEYVVCVLPPQIAQIQHTRPMVL
jgi:hypothetical protein